MYAALSFWILVLSFDWNWVGKRKGGNTCRFGSCAPCLLFLGFERRESRGFKGVNFP